MVELDSKYVPLRHRPHLEGTLKSGSSFVLVTAYGDRNDTELQDKLNV